jgi:diaminohydroxyphosphoribosylaminopyrimidine deaminase / 5-amino-6-(5-phosphoribosylamino)uracil reductase
MTKKTDQHYMLQAIALASKTPNKLSPNPYVGCVIVKDDEVVGQGSHEEFGGPHAEVNALESSGTKAQGATAYVSLEPCNHFGKTPPCVNALIAAGIGRVVIADIDPNPLVAGQGIKTLEAAGIKVSVGCCQKEARALNKFFYHYHTKKRPYIIAKWAMSLDGKTITHHDDDKKITSDTVQQKVHQLRGKVDAILVGVNTIISDDPMLTARVNPPSKYQPKRIVLDPRARTPINSKVVAENTFILVGENSHSEKLKNSPADVVSLPLNEQGGFCMKALMQYFYQQDITSLLVEGGETTHHYFLENDLVDEIQSYMAPVLIGSLKNKKKLQNVNFEKIGCDQLASATLGEE